MLGTSIATNLISGKIGICAININANMPASVPSRYVGKFTKYYVLCKLCINKLIFSIILTFNYDALPLMTAKLMMTASDSDPAVSFFR